jgi:two-component system, sensor histidine kinase PdtaS
MKKRFLTNLLVLICSVPVVAQSGYIDSLLKVADTARVDTLRFDTWQELGTHHMESDPPLGIQFGNRMLELARRLNDSVRIGFAYQMLGVCYDYKNDLDSCLYYLYKADTIHISMNRPDRRAHIISDIALAYYLRGNYELSLRNHLQALELRRKSGNKNHVSKSLNNIGLLYKQRKDYATAVKYYRESIMLKEELNDERGLVNTYMNLGSMYQSLEQYDSAYAYAKKCNDLAVKLNLESDVAGAKGNMAEALLTMNRLSEAEAALKEAKLLSEKAGCRNCMFTVYQGLGNIHIRRNEPAKALPLFKQGLKLATILNRPQIKYAFYADLADCYRRLNNFPLAFVYLDSASKLSEQLLNEENLRQINEMTAVYQTNEKEKQIEKLNAERVVTLAEARRRKQERNYFLISSILFLALAAAAYKAYAANRKKKELLNRQNLLIERSLREKEILLKEIHHRVKNNLQLVSSLLSLQTDYIKDEHALDAVKESRNRVHSMALIHQNLYQEDDLTGIKVEEYIGKLCDNLFNSYNIRPGKISLLRDIQPIHLDVEIVVPLGLMLNELITNCLKYAFPEGEGTIKIMLEENSSQLKISVYDNGVGLPPDINITESGTFGFKMINAFIQKMKGDIKIYSEDGTKVELTVRNFKRPVHE